MAIKIIRASQVSKSRCVLSLPHEHLGGTFLPTQREAQSSYLSYLSSQQGVLVNLPREQDNYAVEYLHNAENLS